MIACLLLTGCAQDPVVKVVDLPLANPPPASMKPPGRLTKIPDRKISVAELASETADLQTRYYRETGKLRVLQTYVKRLQKSRKGGTARQ